MTIRYAPTATLRHNETLPGGEVEISISVRYIQTDYQPERELIIEKAMCVLGGLIGHCDQYRKQSD